MRVKLHLDHIVIKEKNCTTARIKSILIITNPRILRADENLNI